MIQPILQTNFNSTKYAKFDRKNACNNVVTNPAYTTNFALSNYNINFTGLSLASEYPRTSDYLSALILKGKNTKYGANGSILSSKNIEQGVQRLFQLNKVYLPFTMSDPLKVKWKSYIPQEVKVFSINKINDARISRFNQWKEFLENPMALQTGSEYDDLKKEISQDDCLKFVIWNAINSDIKNNNRHIPVPFDIRVLQKTVKWLNSIEPENRRLQAGSVNKFLSIYTHKLKDELLMQRPELLMTKEYLPEADSCWVKIPSSRRNPIDKLRNICALECLSNENWCTRSSVDKAEAALEDGDFYLFLRRDKDNKVWQTVLGMTSYKGKIDQIQGANNDNLIPLRELEGLKEFLQSNNLQCVSGICDEGPKAVQQLLIAEKLKEVDLISGLSLAGAITKRNDFAMLNLLFQNVEPQIGTSVLMYDSTKKPLFKIPSYKPYVLLDIKKGIKVPFSYLGIDEDVLLANVYMIEGDWNLYVKGDLYNSRITTFPKNLKKVSGKIVCTEEQYKKFGENMLKVVSDPKKIIIH